MSNAARQPPIQDRLHPGLESRAVFAIWWFTVAAAFTSITLCWLIRADVEFLVTTTVSASLGAALGASLLNGKMAGQVYPNDEFDAIMRGGLVALLSLIWLAVIFAIGKALAPPDKDAVHCLFLFQWMNCSWLVRLLYECSSSVPCTLLFYGWLIGPIGGMFGWLLFGCTKNRLKSGLE